MQNFAAVWQIDYREKNWPAKYMGRFRMKNEPIEVLDYEIVGVN
jgi:hypothetical protein